MVLVLLSNKWRSGGDPTKVSGALLSHLRPFCCLLLRRLCARSSGGETMPSLRAEAMRAGRSGRANAASLCPRVRKRCLE